MTSPLFIMNGTIGIINVNLILCAIQKKNVTPTSNEKSPIRFITIALKALDTALQRVYQKLINK